MRVPIYVNVNLPGRRFISITKGQNTVLLQGPRRQREAVKHFGPAPGMFLQPNFGKKCICSFYLDLTPIFRCPRLPHQAIRPLQGPQVRECPWPTCLQRLQEVNFLSVEMPFCRLSQINILTSPELCLFIICAKFLYFGASHWYKDR